MTIHARAIPSACRIVFLHIRRKQEGIIYWRPHFLSDDVTEGKLLQGPTLPGLQPKDLQIVRAGHNYDLLEFTIATAFGSRAQKELVAATINSPGHQDRDSFHTISGSDIMRRNTRGQTLL